MNAEDWTHISDVWLNDGKGLAVAAVEAKGEARRLMARRSRTDPERTVVARWRDGVPASVRVFADATRVPGRREAYEWLLVAYVAGTNPLTKPNGTVIIDTREPEHRDEELNP